jgi:hypothetical protein
MLRRMLLMSAVALAMAAMMLAMAMPTFAKGGAAGNCGPPGQGVRIYAHTPGESVPGAYGGPPGEAVQDVCAPGHQKM